MAVKIRLKRIGKIRTPHYRVVVADAHNKRDGRSIEEIGTYTPKSEPSQVRIDSERAQYWLGVGAQPTEAATALLKVTGDWQAFKGEPAPAPSKVAEPARDKAEIFNEALKEAYGEPGTEAVTSKKSGSKQTEGTSAGPAEASAEAGTSETASGEGSAEQAETGGTAS